jgi:hypothetical protein
MSSQTEAQKLASKQTLKATPVLEAGQEKFLEDLIHLFLREHAEEKTKDPFTFDPERAGLMKEQLGRTAHQSAANAFNNMMAGLAGTGNARGGAARAGAADIASNLGGQLGQIESDIDLRQIASMWPDLMNALAFGQGVMTPQYAWDRDLSNAFLGQGSTLTQLSGQPGPAQMIGQGLGQLGGQLGAAALMPTTAVPMAAGAAAGCWVAMAIFGEHSLYTHLARHWVNNVAPKWFKRLYLRYGERFAKRVEKSDLLKRLLRPLFLSFARWGARDIQAEGLRVQS